MVFLPLFSRGSCFQANPEESAELLALCLSEFPKKIAGCSPSFDEALKQLQELAAEGVASAAASAPRFEEVLRAHEEAVRLKWERKQQELAVRKRIYEEHRQKEVGTPP